MILNRPHLPSVHCLSSEPLPFADRLVERYLAGVSSLEDLLEAEIDAPTIMRALLPARRAAAAAPGDMALAGRCRALADLFDRLRVASLKSKENTWRQSLIDTYLSRETEAIDLVKCNGGYRMLETLPDRLQEFKPGVIKRLVERHAMLAIMRRDLRTALFPRCQFLPSGHVVRGLAEVWTALGSCDRLSVIAFLLQPDPGIRGFQPMELLRAGRIYEVVALARDRI